MTKHALEGLEPQAVFSYFEEICHIPHGSGNTAAISRYLVDFAKENCLRYTQDTLGNVILFVEGNGAQEDRAPVILQGHMDMVCEQDASSTKDMKTEGLDVTHDGKVVFAKGTTLGGDDGIAVAYLLALAADKSLPHPPLELILTVDEETGMDGAMGIDLSALRGRQLINLDSEDEGVFTVSCAGGAKSTLHLPVEYTTSNAPLYSCKLEGLRGGHSGVEIHKNRTNANLELGKFLAVIADIAPMQIATLSGGSKDNVIPQEAAATFISALSAEKIQAIADERTASIQATFDEPNAKFSVKAYPVDVSTVLTEADTDRLLRLLTAVPNGVQAMSQAIAGLVETSLNLGVLTLTDTEAALTFAVRSSVDAQKVALVQTLRRQIEALGGSYTERGTYPAWEYKATSALRETFVAAYQKLYGTAPKIEAIHAGLECGLFSEKIENLDCISLGPQMHDIHTARETLEIASVKRTWDLLLEVLKTL